MTYRYIYKYISGNAKTVVLKHFLSSILNSLFWKSISVLKSSLKELNKKKLQTEQSSNSRQVKYFRITQNHSHQFLKIKIREFLFHLAPYFLCVQFLPQVLNQDTPQPFSQPPLSFFPPLKSFVLTLCFTLLVNTHACSFVKFRVQLGFIVISVHYHTIITHSSNSFLLSSKALSSLLLPGSKRTNVLYLE